MGGLIKGDGNIKVPNVVRSSNNKLRYPSITIAFTLKDQLLTELLAAFGRRSCI